MSEEIKLKAGTLPEKDSVIISFVFEGGLKNLNLPDVKARTLLLEKAKRHDFEAKTGQTIRVENLGDYGNVFLVGLGKTSEFKLLTYRNVLADVIRKLQSLRLTDASLEYFKELGDDYFEIGKNLALSLYLANYNFNQYKSDKERKKYKPVDRLNFYIGIAPLAKLEAGIEYGKLVAEGVYLARDLVNQPASHVDPTTLENEAFKIEKESKGKIKVEVLDEDECKKLGMGAFLGVAKGSVHKPKFIVLKYSAIGPKKSICLVGKSITFDSGGLSLKPSEYMEDMKIDMAGGAAVLGVFKILSKTDVSTDVYGILPACENMPSGHAMRPGDVVTALNGKTIEVLNTDAEGRLALADGLSYANKYLKPDIMIDIATLTGACVVALGDDLAGLFGNDSSLIKSYKQIARAEGDRLWPMPLYKPYLKRMKSDIADLKNIGGGRYGGAITAALFLSEFVGKTKWLHIDIAGPAFRSEGARGVLPKGATGWGVASLIEFIRSN